VQLDPLEFLHRLYKPNNGSGFR